MRTGTWFIILALVALAIASLACGGGSDPSAPDAAVTCRFFVEEHLRAPSTAKHAPLSQTDITESTVTSGSWTVRAWVDAENAFGAMIRTRYICRVQYVDDGNWRLVDLEFLD